MKKIFNILLLSLVGIVSAQGTGIETTDVGKNALMQFGGTDRGMQIPRVDTVPTISASSNFQGAIIFDTQAGVVKWCDGTQWITATETGSTFAASTRTNSSKGVVVGDTKTDYVGGSSLYFYSDPTKSVDGQARALVLPNINNAAANIKSPVAGIICYDTSFTPPRVAIFNGVKWDYWWSN